MKKLFFFIFSFLLVLLVLPKVNANYINTDPDLVRITNWYEDDFIENNNLYVSIALRIVLEDKLFDENISNFVFEIDPNESEHQGKIIKNLYFEICKGSIGLNNYKDISINCTKRLKKIEEKEDYYNISLNENIHKNDILIAKINYTLLNFLDKNDEKLIILNTDCGGNPGGTCPNYTNINKYVSIPTGTAVRIYPEDSVLKRDSVTGRLVIKLTDFEPYQVAGHSRYENKAILFTDLKQIRNREHLYIGITLVVTLLISFGAALIITYHIKPKHQKESEKNFNDKFDKINNKLNSQTEFIKKINQNLKKIENKIKPTKPKPKKKK